MRFNLINKVFKIITLIHDIIDDMKVMLNIFQSLLVLVSDCRLGQVYLTGSMMIGNQPIKSQTKQVSSAIS